MDAHGTHYRHTLVEDRNREVDRIHQLLEDAGITPDVAASDVMGAPRGRAMLAALIGRATDPETLAGLAEERLRAKLPEVRKGLRGRFGQHHASCSAGCTPGWPTWSTWRKTALRSGAGSGRRSPLPGVRSPSSTRVVGVGEISAHAILAERYRILATGDRIRTGPPSTRAHPRRGGLQAPGL
jgi:hypothetical protein